MCPLFRNKYIKNISTGVANIIKNTLVETEKTIAYLWLIFLIIKFKNVIKKNNFIIKFQFNYNYIFYSKKQIIHLKNIYF